jgi:hypothetical protein
MLVFLICLINAAVFSVETLFLRILFGDVIFLTCHLQWKNNEVLIADAITDGSDRIIFNVFFPE